MQHLEDRIHYALPLNHVDFENIRCNICIRENNEDVSQYRPSQDGLLIQVKCYSGQEIPSMSNLVVVNNLDPNWIAPIYETLI